LQEQASRLAQVVSVFKLDQQQLITSPTRLVAPAALRKIASPARPPAIGNATKAVPRAVAALNAPTSTRPPVTDNNADWETF